ncbi:hypothetical protein J2S50_003452 [Streptomyces sp. DSM 40167]|nr:hypothetical protein [Streptomyces sp. DSM 40167]
MAFTDGSRHDMPRLRPIGRDLAGTGGARPGSAHANGP